MTNAEQIMQHLGGAAFAHASRCEHFAEAAGNGLGFRLPYKRSKDGSAACRISPEAGGNYEMIFFRIKSHRLERVAEFHDVAPADLATTFANQTGLPTR